ncbi:dipeptidase [Paenibacillus oenotherae]|uniref:Dipeptidase n=1 Tax=Paenibacillus oenotherae TaxID=1435645 RepID=A0ABS7D028_9BACL|nr:dipeptidase [Paenibacillus oenotherae]MBW7473219.1 dipeptidase [Paenibacillus oenotherae]
MNGYRTADFHCDVLWKLLDNPELSFADDETNKLDVTLPRLRHARALLQTFAIYIPERMEKTVVPILHSIDLFHRKIVAAPGMRFVRGPEDMRIARENGEIGALLSLEGADGLQGDLALLRVLFELGLRAVGLTWNNANWGADGAMEPRGGGLTGKGRSFVEECNKLGILLDVSHLSQQSFWDMADVTKRPLIASHSNTQTICSHPRNLCDDQVRAIIAMDGLIGLTYVPQFVRADGKAGVDDVLRHVEHICGLGGANHLMLGSDFDGIDNHVVGLSHPGEVYNLYDSLVKRYSDEQVKAIFAENTYRFLTTYLPN